MAFLAADRDDWRLEGDDARERRAREVGTGEGDIPGILGNPGLEWTESKVNRFAIAGLLLAWLTAWKGRSHNRNFATRIRAVKRDGGQQSCFFFQNSLESSHPLTSNTA